MSNKAPRLADYRGWDRQIAIATTPGANLSMLSIADLLATHCFVIGEFAAVRCTSLRQRPNWRLCEFRDGQEAVV
ncbi:hypothetical protein [Trinickia sp.]|uniref:hypothetical protein n=1 Tax=Trinickia sp. TaxID=2571163 RepID=UPI003F7D5922